MTAKEREAIIEIAHVVESLADAFETFNRVIEDAASRSTIDAADLQKRLVLARIKMES